ncbi:tetratricopeptide repeat protein [Granulicella sp. WH15]|uniref:tetratricopeptide repeat protein n=1 Tax=Granulicella sp. WH15 TaxID=2602070 RepID=UPI0013673721|nr:tetratricopeptide repeat protein [Granulicella sp. WH15]QHN02866.1 tetratricopeptide repeat protein [Granulicella sp. WH15]
MTLRHSASTLLTAASLLLASHAVLAQVPASAAPVVPDHSAAYYHEGLAHMYEEMAISGGRPDYATQAIEQYKLALDADPDSRFLRDGLADLYFKVGRIREAVTAAQDQVKKNPDDVEAHQLLGKVYLRSLGDLTGTQAGEMLALAIGEYEKIAQLTPADVETHLLLGQLYGLNHDSAKAEAQFKLAQKLDSNSEEVVLNMARLYSEQGDIQHAASVLAAVPEGDRSARVDFALGATYDQLRKPKLAADAYRAALEQDPENVDTERGLASALMADNQLAAALEVLQKIVAAEPNDVQSQVHLSEVQRRMGHYDDALVTLQKAKALSPNGDNLELPYNEALIYDSLGKYDQAIATLNATLASTSHPDGKYTDPEKANRTIFLDRLGIIESEANRPAEAAAAYRQIIALGGDNVARGYQGVVDAYRNAHMWKEAVAAAEEASKALPKEKSVQLMYAFQLADTGKAEDGLTLAKAQLNGGPEDRDSYVAIANINLRLHRSKDAYEALDKAEALIQKPEEKLYLYLLRATIADKDKQYAEAEVQYRKVLAIDPNNAGALNDLGYMLADRGVRLPEALTMIQKAVELDPQNGAYLDSLGWVYFKMGQYTLAEENLHKAIERVATDPSIHDHLGEVYDKTNRLKLAVAQWDRAMVEYAHSLPADADPADVNEVKRKLDNARVKLAKNSK